MERYSYYSAIFKKMLILKTPDAKNVNCTHIKVRDNVRKIRREDMKNDKRAFTSEDRLCLQTSSVQLEMFAFHLY